MVTYTLSPPSPDKRADIITSDGEYVGQAVRVVWGLWGLFDADDRALTERRFKTAQDALEAFEAVQNKL